MTKLVAKILGNILKDLENEKFRRVKFSKIPAIISSKSAKFLMEMVGFTEVDIEGEPGFVLETADVRDLKMLTAILAKPFDKLV